MAAIHHLLGCNMTLAQIVSDYALTIYGDKHRATTTIH